MPLQSITENVVDPVLREREEFAKNEVHKTDRLVDNSKCEHEEQRDPEATENINPTAAPAPAPAAFGLDAVVKGIGCGIGQPRAPVADPDLVRRFYNVSMKDKDEGCGDYPNDFIDYLFNIEPQFVVPSNYLDGRIIEARHRAILMNRLVLVHRSLNLLPDTLSISINYIDRYLYLSPHTETRSLHLVGITALYIASKCEELSIPDIEDLVYITDYECSKQQILEMEKQMLKNLGFAIYVPHSLVFLRRFSKCCDVKIQIHYLAKYLIELSFLDCSLTDVHPSKLAAAALFLAVNIFSVQPFLSSNWKSRLRYFTRYNKSDLEVLAHKLAVLMKNAKAEDKKLNEVYRKYCEDKHFRVALLPQVRNFQPNIGSLRRPRMR